MSDLVRWNRRVLLRNLGLMTGALGTRRGHAARANPRALINVVVFGGWDSFWFHNAVAASEVAGHVATDGAIVSASQGEFVSPPGSAGYQGVLAPARTLTNTSPPGWPFHIRYPDRFLRPHPNQPAAMLGPGYVDFSDADLASFTIWRGIKSEGGHGTGNRVLQTGTTGDQTSSFSPLVALELAARQGVLPLHYTQLATTRSLLYNQNGPIPLSEPVMLPDMAAWRALTGPSNRELPPARRALLDRALDNLASPARLQLESNRAAYEAFNVGHRGAVSLMDSGYASGKEFTAAFDAYRAALGGISNHLFRQWFPLSGGSDDDALAYRFALAEFLVTHRLAAVVDLPGRSTDYHYLNDDDAIVMLMHLTCFRTLLARLKAFVEPDGSRAIDRTTVVMHTEMERSPTLMPNVAAPERTGTAHWDLMTSAFLGGAGIANGRVVGEFSRPQGNYPSDTYQTGHFAPLPIDFSTGEVSKSGGAPSIRSLFPTILQAFGATSRSQLKTMAPVLGALLR